MLEPIEMICIHEEDGSIRPYRFRLKNSNEEKVTYQVKGLMDKETGKKLGKSFLKFWCFCPDDNRKNIIEVTFLKDDCKWFVTNWSHSR